MKGVNLPKLILVDKPKGMSSFTVIRHLRRQTGIRKFGHAGTLDPLASGLMLIGVESGTKLLTDLVGLDKVYETTIMLGEARTTDDMEGDINKEKPYEHDLTEGKIKEALTSLLGEQLLPVSAYSAIKKDGVPFYKKARQAEKTGRLVSDLPVRRMNFYDLELLDLDEISTDRGSRLLVTLRAHVSSGTYVRSLGVALGEKLGYPAVVYELRRTKVGTYDVTEAWGLVEIDFKKMLDNPGLDNAHI